MAERGSFTINLTRFILAISGRFTLVEARRLFRMKYTADTKGQAWALRVQKLQTRRYFSQESIS